LVILIILGCLFELFENNLWVERGYTSSLKGLKDYLFDKGACSSLPKEEEEVTFLH
jgi:hypothetical protein